MKNSKNIANFIVPAIFFIFLILIWEITGRTGIVPKFLLPTPTEVLKALWSDRVLLSEHLKVTLSEAFLGLVFGVLSGIIFAVFMDLNERIKQAIYPLIILSQTIPTVAIAPLIVLWFGYGILPKVLLVSLTTFFPITIGVFEGFQSVGEEYLTLFRSMNAGRLKTFTLLKFPMSLPYLFTGLKISVSYAIVGAVISEWLGGFSGLGVYMTRLKKAYAFDKMFAVILIISLTSLICMKIVELFRKILIKWEE